MGSDNLTIMHKLLIDVARIKHGEIFPTVGRKSLAECFTKDDDNKLILWFNTADNSSHTLSEKTEIKTYLKEGA